MKPRPANSKALTKTRPASGKVVSTVSKQLAGSELSPRRGDYSRGEIVVSPIRQFRDRKIVQALSAQLGHRVVMPGSLYGTLALTPALSPKRGRIVRRSFECREAAITQCASGKPEIAKHYPLSPGERAGVRASVKTNFAERDGIHVASYVTKAIPKKQLERKLHEAVRLARARLERGQL